MITAFILNTMYCDESFEQTIIVYCLQVFLVTSLSSKDNYASREKDSCNNKHIHSYISYFANINQIFLFNI